MGGRPSARDRSPRQPTATLQAESILAGRRTGTHPLRTDGQWKFGFLIKERWWPSVSILAVPCGRTATMCNLTSTGTIVMTG